ncbi:MAG TPA: proton-conducting transporter membrane subunit [Aggregatilineales bacterium]|nr:proton-conducting transporter membrane subunit [Aggregatilineales bacterium]
MENFAALVPLIILIPFAGAVINLFLGRYMSERMVGTLASGAAGIAFIIAATMTVAMPNFGYEGVVVTPPILDSWLYIPSAALNIPWQLRVDTLSLTMMLVITGIGTLIHIYAIGYMHGDSRFPRFFVYLNMFLGFMLILVTGNNFLVTFVGWEGVGLCSFLLIGFWFDKKKGEGWRNSNAARKAFIVNRVGDFGFLMAIFLTFWTFGTLDYYKPGEVLHVAGGHGAEVAPAEGTSGDSHSEAAPAEGGHGETDSHNESVTAKGIFGQTEDLLAKGGHIVHFGPFTLPLESVLTIITLFMVLGVTGKSAQIPLFVWLPDAMAGPTPVSALIHAATMVTAGIYLVTRSSVFFHAAPISSAVVTLIGSATALMAGFVALGQWDIKKVLAYSTVSQLGFMVAAVGLGGYAAGMFHLVTHAFFKALLFLGSGSVIHAMEHGHHHAHADDHGHGSDGEHHEDEAFDPQDMRNMGGLRKRMPITFWTYLIGTLALAGIFPLSGFWSKDEILGKAFNSGFNDGKVEGFIALGLLLAAAFMTAFYMWRQIRLVFLGKPRTAAAEHAPESVALMTFPLIVLAVLSIFGGLLNIPLGFSLPLVPPEILTLWLEHSVPYTKGLEFNLILAVTATVVAVAAILLADRFYGANPLTEKGKDKLERGATRPYFRLANAKLYWDETYFRLIENPYNRLSAWLANKLDWEFWHDRVHNTLIRDTYKRASTFLANPVDRGAIDRGFLRIGEWAGLLGGRLRGFSTGYVRTYIFTFLVGALVVIVLILLPLLRAGR